MDVLAAECARVVKQDGVVIVAVPPITVAWIAQDDMRNTHHVHHLPPAAWHAKLSRFFGAIECHGHQGSGKWGELEVQTSEISRWVDQTTIRETDFEFPAVPVERLDAWQCITAIFVCREPKPVADGETIAERKPSAWNMGALAARLIAQEQAEISSLKRESERIASDHANLRSDHDRLRSELEVMNMRYHELTHSTTWRMTEPVRRIVSSLRRTILHR